jgi:asparagine synthase (glutamine-hydrolysing)
MSAICGIWQRNNAPVSSTRLTRLMHAQAHYGPDGSGVWGEDSIRLGQQMLCLTPEALHEQQPAAPAPFLANCPLIITADSWLDNRQELCEALSIPRGEWPTIPDSQVILAAYQKWDTACPGHLLGDFAFAIWDSAKQRLFCARDHVGARPFYYYDNDQEFLFATDLQALLGVITPQIEPMYLKAKVMYGRFLHNELTFYARVRKLPPAHFLVVSVHRLQQGAWWQPGELPELHLPTDEAYVEMLRHMLEEAVRCRLRTHQTVGTHLSGGLDSSSITMLAARQLRQQGRTLTAFSWSPPLPADLAISGLPANDERRHIEQICRQEQLMCHYTRLTETDELQALAWGLDRDAIYFIGGYDAYVNQCAAQAQVRVLLSGWGGDEFITAHVDGYLAACFVQGRWRTLAREMDAKVGRSSGAYWKAVLGLGYARVLTPLLPYPLYARLHPHLADPPAYAPFIHPELRGFLQAVPLPETINVRETPNLHEYQRTMFAHGHLTRRSEMWAAYGAQHQLYFRYPLLDRRIVDFACRIPAHLFVRNGISRYLFRQAMHPLRPAWNYNPKFQPGLEAVTQPLVITARRHWLAQALAQPTSLTPAIIQRAKALRLLPQISQATRHSLLERRLFNALQAEYVLVRHPL